MPIISGIYKHLEAEQNVLDTLQLTRELAYLPTSGALVYKDSFGTNHYFTTGGSTPTPEQKNIGSIMSDFASDVINVSGTVQLPISGTSYYDIVEEGNVTVDITNNYIRIQPSETTNYLITAEVVGYVDLASVYTLKVSPGTVQTFTGGFSNYTLPVGYMTLNYNFLYTTSNLVNLSIYMGCSEDANLHLYRVRYIVRSI